MNLFLLLAWTRSMHSRMGDNKGMGSAGPNILIRQRPFVIYEAGEGWSGGHLGIICDHLGIKRLLSFDGVASSALARLCSVTSWSCGREKLSARMSGMSVRVLNSMRRQVSNPPGNYLPQTGLLIGPSVLAGALGGGRAWRGSEHLKVVSLLSASLFYALFLSTQCKTI